MAVKKIPPDDFWERGAVMICPDCNVRTERIIHEEEGFRQRAWKCPRCGDISLHPLDVQAYLAFKKIQKKGAEVKVGKLAESFIIRIPKPIAEILELEKGKTVKLKLANPRELRIASD